MFYGNDQAMLDQIRSGASRAKNEQNAPIGATVQATGDNTVEYWIDGNPVDLSKIVKNYKELGLETQTQFTLSWGNENIIKKSLQKQKSSY